MRIWVHAPVSRNPSAVHKEVERIQEENYLCRHPISFQASAIRKSQTQDTELYGYQPDPAGLVLMCCLFIQEG